MRSQSIEKQLIEKVKIGAGGVCDLRWGRPELGRKDLDLHLAVRESGVGIVILGGIAVFAEVIDFDGGEQGEEGVRAEFIVKEGCDQVELGSSSEVEEVDDD